MGGKHMKIVLQNIKDNPRALIRRAGYSEHFDSRSGETSYSRRLDRNVFPKFHAYLSERDGGVEVSLHLDQKQPSYGVGHMHSGDYDGPLIERELERIKQSFENASAPLAEEPEQKKGFFGKLFG
jgi:hypothetical protein